MAKARKKKRTSSMPFGYKLSLILHALAAILTLAQFVFKTYFGIDLGITFFGREMF
jgi:hypothetical protein